MYRPQLSVTLAEGLAKAGRRELAYSTICEAVSWAETRDRVLDLIDLLRVKGEILASMSPEDTSEGEACLLQSLQLARERGLLSFELRSRHQPRKILGCSSPARQSARTSRPDIQPIFGGLPDTRPRYGGQPLAAASVAQLSCQKRRAACAPLLFARCRALPAASNATSAIAHRTGGHIPGKVRSVQKQPVIGGGMFGGICARHGREAAEIPGLFSMKNGIPSGEPPLKS